MEPSLWVGGWAVSVAQMESLPGVLGQIRGCTLVTFVYNHMNSRENRTKFVRNSCEFGTNSREFTPMNRLQGCPVLAPLVWGAVWAWWMLLGGPLLDDA